MSATIFYEKKSLTKRRKSLDTCAPSSFMEAMAQVGWELPCRLFASDARTMRAMGAAYSKLRTNNPFAHLAELLEELDEDEAIDLEASW